MKFATNPYDNVCLTLECCYTTLEN